MQTKRVPLDELRDIFIASATDVFPAGDAGGIRKAMAVAEAALDGLKRASGEPAFAHSLGTALSLVEMRLDRASVEAGLLLKAYESGRANLASISGEPLFSPSTPALVEGAARVSRYSFRKGRTASAESFRKLILTVAKDVRVILVKLADRVNSMRTLAHLPPEARSSLSRETMDIYAPLANRLGVHSMKRELEDLAFRFLEPEKYQNLKTLVALKQSEREAYIASMMGELGAVLSENGIRGDISGRPKHFWSIQKKMERRGVEFHDLYDVTAFRVIVDSVAQCYQVLGLAHFKWRPVTGTFDDYVAVPKPNGYQSLHTAVVGPEGERVEIQIRTGKMHEVAERGVAAHWLYKEADGPGLDDDGARHFGRLHDILSGSQTQFNEAVLESLRTDLFDDVVFVFTPGGDVRELAKDATPVDFAYAVHTEVGDRCTGALVNGRIVPLSHTLKNGDIAQILTNPKARPSTHWLEFVKTSRARQKIKHFLTEARRAKEREEGRLALERGVRELGGNLNRMLKDGPRVVRALDKLKCRSLEELYLSLKRGAIAVDWAINALAPEISKEPDAEAPAPPSRLAAPTPLKRESGILVGGQNDMLFRYARCCNPLVGDDIFGYITRGRGVTVHRRDCPRIEPGMLDRLVEARWASNQSGRMPARLRVTLSDRPAVSTSVSETFKKLDIPMSVIYQNVRDGLRTLVCSADIHGAEELRRAMEAVKTLKGVREVVRLSES